LDIHWQCLAWRFRHAIVPISNFPSNYRESQPEEERDTEPGPSHARSKASTGFYLALEFVSSRAPARAQKRQGSFESTERYSVQFLSPLPPGINRKCSLLSEPAIRGLVSNALWQLPNDSRSSRDRRSEIGLNAVTAKANCVASTLVCSSRLLCAPHRSTDIHLARSFSISDLGKTSNPRPTPCPSLIYSPLHSY
jgi:hypothetical protein